MVTIVDFGAFLGHRLKSNIKLFLQTIEENIDWEKNPGALSICTTFKMTNLQLPLHIFLMFYLKKKKGYMKHKNLMVSARGNINFVTSKHKIHKETINNHLLTMTSTGCQALQGNPRLSPVFDTRLCLWSP